MIWLLVVVGIVFLGWLFLRARPADPPAANIKQRAKLLPAEQQEAMAEEIRTLARTGYDRLSNAAPQSGKSPQVANEAGALDAAFCVLANSNLERQNASVRQAMQLETVPFNMLEPSLGREAMTEYLVWKFFPERAEMAPLRTAMNIFVKKVVDDAPNEAEADDHIYRMIYSSKFDWQILAIEAMRVSGDTNV